MRKYLTPEFDLLKIDYGDVITASFGRLEQLPSGDDTPIRDVVDEPMMDW